MTLNSKAAIAACFATLFIVSSTVSIAQSGGEIPVAPFGSGTPTVI